VAQGEEPVKAKTKVLGRLKMETWKTKPDSYGLFMIYPLPDKLAVQFTFWRRKLQFQWKREP
jgi:hypothetical protein